MTARVECACTVAYQGGPGAYGEAAVDDFWAGAARALPVRTFGALVRAVLDAEAEFAVLPVWNSAIGPVREACETLRAARDRVEWVDEVVVPVRHALLGLPGSSSGGVRAVGSHPAALEQCRGLLSREGLRAVPAWDTAGAALELARLGGLAGTAPNERPAPPWHAGLGLAPHELAAIASARVAERLGLVVLADAVQDDPENVTRFAVVRAREGARW